MLEYVFEAIDIDGDGGLSIDELVNSLKGAPASPMTAHFQSISAYL